MTHLRILAVATAFLGTGILLAQPSTAQSVSTNPACQTITDQNKAFCDMIEAQQASARAQAVRAASATPAAANSSAQDRIRERPVASPNCPAPSKGRPCRTF